MIDPIVDVVEEVIAADVAAFGVGYPNKIPPPPPPDGGWTVDIPDDGWTVDIPGAGLIDIVPPSSLLSRYRSWLAFVIVALLVAVGIVAFVARGSSTTPTASQPPPSSASAPGIATASASAPSTCAQTVSAGPITAVFDQATFSTTYTAPVSSGGCGGATFQWGGPDCGTWYPQDVQPMTASTAGATMFWYHPHPPCDPTTNHANVTVTLSVLYSGGGTSCSYQGAESGIGPACTRR